MPIPADILTQLADVLARIYSDHASARTMATTAGLFVERIDFDAKPRGYWVNILQEAENQGATQRLLDRAVADYSKDAPLVEACQAYYVWVNAGRPDLRPLPACPYPGMVPFRAEDARFFYGREDEIEQMLRHLRHQRLLFVVGPSGSGKSSLIAAGLLPTLARSSHFPPDYWLVRTLRPGSRPLETLSAAIHGDASQPVECVSRLLAANTSTQRLLLVIDQFEETFSLASPEQCQQFISAIQVLRTTEQCVLVIAMRADYLTELMNSDLWPVNAGQRLEIAALRGDALRRAIRRPASAVDVEIAEALVERLMADAAGEPGVLPMLQETLQLLWMRMSQRRISLENYEQLGDGQRSGLAVAIAVKADAAFAELTPNEQAMARRIFLWLIQFGQGRFDTRRQLPESELRSATEDPTRFERVLQYLAGNRLLTLSGGEGGAERLVDISHERLISEWPTLSNWVNEYKQSEQARRRLEVKAQEWIRLGRAEGGLLDRAELAEAEAWLIKPDAVVLGASSDLLALLETSRRAINPGWHRLGTPIAVTGAVSLAALAAWMYITIATSSVKGVGRVTSVVFFAGLAFLVVLTIWQFGRSGPYFLQRLSYTVAARRSLQATLGMLTVTTTILWVGFGVRSWQLSTECNVLGYNWNSTSTGIAVLDQGIDPIEAQIFELTLQNASAANLIPVRVAITPPPDLDKCQSRFQHQITLGSIRSTDESESVYSARVMSPQSGEDEFTISVVGMGCGEMFDLAYQVAIALGYSRAQIDNCQNAGPTTCEPWYENERATALYQEGQFAQAEAKFNNIVDRYPDFAWAHHNLGVTRLVNCGAPAEAVDELRTAVNLSQGMCGKFWYDLAGACRSAGEYSCALEAAQKTIRVDPSLVDAYNTLAVIQRELGQFSESASALDEYEKRLDERSLLQQQLVLEKNRGILAFERGQFDEALRLLERTDQQLQLTNRFRGIAKDRPLRYEEEIVFFLARIHEVRGDSAQACNYWHRYSALPRGCGAGEAERRDYASNRINATACQP